MKPQFSFQVFKFSSFIIFFSLSMALKAQITCGVPTPVNHSFVQPPVNTATSLQQHYSLPIHFYIITNQGALPLDFKIQTLRRQLAFANSNSAFGGVNMSFYVSGMELVESPTQFNGGGNLVALYNLIHDDNAINVYIVNSVIINGEVFGGAALLPILETPINNTISIRGSEGNETLLAHELGHHFNLLHTFEDTFLSDLSFQNCSTEGDKICDTGVQLPSNNPDIPYCQSCQSSCACESPDQNCTFPFLGTMYTTALNKNNIMNYTSCPSWFSAQQREKIRNELLFNSYRAHLIQGVNPPEIELPSEFGYVYRTNPLTPTPTTSLFGDFPMMLSWNNNTPINSNTDSGGSYYIADKGNFFPIPNYTGKIIPTRSGNGFFAASNGVTTLDRIKIQQHILGTEFLPAPFAWIAADVTNDGNITTADNIQLQKIILGQITSFTNVPAWRFVPSLALQNQSFASSFNSNPFTASWNYNGNSAGYNTVVKYFDDLIFNLRHPDIDQTSTFSLEAIKSGDVNFSAEVNYAEPQFNRPQLRTNETYRLQDAEKVCLEPGKTYTINIGAQGDNTIYGYQMGITFDPNTVEATGVANGQAKYFSLDNFNLNGLKKGELKIAWLDIETNEKIKVSERKELFKLYVKPKVIVCDLSKVFQLNDRTLNNLFYDENGRLIDLQLFLTAEAQKKEDTDQLLLNVFPNPTSNEVNFEVNLLSKTKIDITLRDSFGKTINLKKSAEPGISQIVVNQELQSLSKGVIYYFIEVGAKTYSGTFFRL
jgi:hypothetical protein